MNKCEVCKGDEYVKEYEGKMLCLNCRMYEVRKKGEAHIKKKLDKQNDVLGKKGEYIHRPCQLCGSKDDVVWYRRIMYLCKTCHPKRRIEEAENAMQLLMLKKKSWFDIVIGWLR